MWLCDVCLCVTFAAAYSGDKHGLPFRSLKFLGRSHLNVAQSVIFQQLPDLLNLLVIRRTHLKTTTVVNSKNTKQEKPQPNTHSFHCTNCSPLCHLCPC